MEEVKKYIREELVKLSAEENKQKMQRFFKGKINTLGVMSGDIGSVGKKAWAIVKPYSKAEIFSLCEDLWETEYMEESFIACSLSFQVKKQYEPSDLKIFKLWVDKYIDNWATCDTFCTRNIGELIFKFPELVEEIVSWSKEENMWLKRASAVSFIKPAKKGFYLDEVFRIAETQLMHPEDLVQKGYGWLLKVASEKHLHEVHEFVMQRKAYMPRTSLRYAIEKMPSDLKKEAMEK